MPPQTEAPSNPGNVEYIACYQMSGASSYSGGFRDNAPAFTEASCADLARHGVVYQGETTPSFHAPTPVTDEVLIGGNTSEFNFRLDPYHGPGTYHASGASSDDSINLNGQTNLDYDWWSNTNGASDTVTVNADGSGWLTATNFGAASGPSLSMSMQWVCAPIKQGSG